MALTPELKKLKAELTGKSARTAGQSRLLVELQAIDQTIMQKSLDEATFASVTKMTSPGGGTCACCGR